MATPYQSLTRSGGQVTPAPITCDEAESESLRQKSVKELGELRAAALGIAREQRVTEATGRAVALEARWKDAEQTIQKALEQLQKAVEAGEKLSEMQRALFNSSEILRLALENTQSSLRQTESLPQVENSTGETVPRAFAAMGQFLDFAGYEFEFSGFATFFQAFQEYSPLELVEDWLLVPFAQLILLDRIRGALDRLEMSDEAFRKAAESREGAFMATAVGSLGRIAEIQPEQILSAVSDIDRILRDDPAKAYERMDFETRQEYCNTVAEFAAKSPLTEREIAAKAIALASAPAVAPTKRGAERRTHVGFYLLSDGGKALSEEIQYKGSWTNRFRAALLRSADVIYLASIELVTIGVIAVILAVAHGRLPSFIELLLFVLPAVECAVATMNILATQMVPPRVLPKMDFSRGIPEEYATVVVVPTLLINEEQTHKAVNDLEVRYLANRDANLHFALLTDPPDSVKQFDQKDQLGTLCSALIEKLNRKYAGQRQGSFFHFHRDRTYNAVEKIWMGWERKRGKLLDFNRLLLGQHDSFALKTGDLSLLPKVKYVITLDLDTQLPRDSARKLVGAMAHPLNRAVVDPATNKVIEGYGILQPRVEISISSAARSRLASIFSGDTGFDIYARAVSDVYQDLFGEGIFTGKGIYEVEVFQQTLEHRFPCNALLSHDLIEGLYARAGLLSDVEIVDDYPSHFSAYSRRKHRWVRGDWQIIFWLLPRVPDYFGKIVRNPLNLVSRWKIIDNLRRSVSEFATFVLLLSIWLFFPKDAAYWTVAAVLLLAFPTYFQFLVSIARAGGARFTLAFWKNLGADFLIANERLFFRITFLCHQGFVTMDAVVRTLIRITLTHRRLLEWETAAEAEIAANRKKSPVETYLDWMPLLSFGLAVAIIAFRPESFSVALPFLTLWALSKTICKWLSRPYHSGLALGAADQVLLRRAALRTWRFFRQYSDEQENWLIPDIVQQTTPYIAHQISTTNLGFLLNARLAAYDFGFMSLPELVSATQKTFDTIQRMPKFRGHLYNWYHTQTLEPLSPRFISTVDNGNFVCSLWTLKQGCLEAMGNPLFREQLWSGLEDHLDVVAEFLPKVRASDRIAVRIREMKSRVQAKPGNDVIWLDVLRGLEVDAAILERELSQAEIADEGKWWAHELTVRLSQLSKMVQEFAPWLLPEFAKYLRAFEIPSDNLSLKRLTLASAAAANVHLVSQLDDFLSRGALDNDTREMAESVRARLFSSVGMCRKTASRLEKIAAAADVLVKEMEFSFLYDSPKRLLSIGYDVEHGCLMNYHYDLFASEARTAAFAAVAKGEIPQESWFRLRRPYASFKNIPVVLSWTGTMFEYLLPALWMKSYSNTMPERSARGAVRAQQKFTRKTRVPWGISESSCSDKNPDGFYRYHAFGVPGLALSAPGSQELVISPYSTFLGLMVDGAGAAKNLRQMEQMGCLGVYGFYEAIDFTASRLPEGKQFEIVACWMAHHQGMSLLAMTNVLHDAPMQRRFHAEPLVQATERLLHERFPRVSKLEKPAKAEFTARELLSLRQDRFLKSASRFFFNPQSGAPGAASEDGAMSGSLAAEHHRLDS